MPRDILDQETYETKLAVLRSAFADAQADLDAAVAAEAIADAGEATAAAEKHVRNASANLQAIRDRIDALTRAREASKIAEAEAAQHQAEVDRREAISALYSKGGEVLAAAKDAQAKFEAFLSSMQVYAALLPQYEDALLPLLAEQRQRQVSDALRHRYEGTLLVGLMELARVPGLHLMEEMTPVEASRSYGGKDLLEHINGRLDYVMRLAAPDLRIDEPAEEAAAA